MIKTFIKNYKTYCNRIIPPEPSSGLWDSFYNNFEDRFRGARSVISDRLSKRYNPLLASLESDCQSKVAIDVGCGRCEFLDLVKKKGYQTFGAEISSELVRKARLGGHSVEASDAVRFLRNCDDNSAAMVASFHVVEHCEASYNFAFLEESYRVLAPKGALIIETPSLLSLFAGHRQFFLDPTHNNPVHPDLLNFMAETVGFKKVQVMKFDPVQGDLRANLSATLSDSSSKKEAEKIEDWLYGPMDLAVIAFKV